MEAELIEAVKPKRVRIRKTTGEPRKRGRPRNESKVLHRVTREGETGLEQLCTRCLEWWPADREFFFAKGKNLECACKACSSNRPSRTPIAVSAAPAVTPDPIMQWHLFGMPRKVEQQNLGQ